MSQTDSAMPVPDIYDIVVYPAFAYQNTHPGKLAAMAILHGLQPAPVDRCRVLEIGCNAAANLIPMAYGLPGSEFVGFDLAAAPIAYGQQKINELGLTNIEVLQADLMATEGLPALAGKFDYIIAHGVYAWVPQAVREALLAYCREHLTEHGVAFISYAALPGAHMLMLTREIMSYRGFDPANPTKSVGEGIDLLRFVAASRPVADGYRVLLERQLEKTAQRGPEVLFHDELASAYQPVLFTQFANHAAQHGLQYFGEAELPGPVDPCYLAETVASVKKMAGADPVAQEQILDFIRMRQYRESLLCHAERSFTTDIDINALQQLRMSSTAQSLADEAAGTRVYTTSVGVRIEAQHPATVAVMEHLIAHCPESVAYAELAALVAHPDGSANLELPVLILRLAISRMIEVEAWEPLVAREVSERPLASLLCRLDVGKNDRLATLMHTMVEMTDPVALKLIPLLDGTRDRAAILAELTRALPEMSPADLAAGLDPALQQLRRTGLLERQRN